MRVKLGYVMLWLFTHKPRLASIKTGCIHQHLAGLCYDDCIQNGTDGLIYDWLFPQ